MPAANAQSSPAAEVSPAIQDYLKAIYRLEKSHGEGRVSVTELAGKLTVAPPSVTNMLKRMEGLKLVSRDDNGKVQLRAAGRAIALEVIRHHRLLETFLIEELGMDWAAAHQEAEVLEHYISERLEGLLDQRLARPVRDPHGEPIPGKDGSMPKREAPSLLEHGAGSSLVIRRVEAQDPTLLQYLQAHDLTPGTAIQIRDIAPFNGPLAVQVGRKVHHISREVAACIFGYAQAAMAETVPT